VNYNLFPSEKLRCRLTIHIWRGSATFWCPLFKADDAIADSPRPFRSSGGRTSEWECESTQQHVAQTQLPASILDDEKKDAAICLCTIFLDPVNEMPPPAHRLEFEPACFGKGVNGRYIKKQKMGKAISEKKDGTAITETEVWATASQKVKLNHRYHFHEGYNNKKNTTMNIQKSIEANTKLDVNVNMQVKMNRNMNMTTKMNMNMNISMNETIHEYEFGHNVKMNMNLDMNVATHVKKNGDY
jgi:hypothetical protein